jgi:tetratricopeptide (TPR) repeat protein
MIAITFSPSGNRTLTGEGFGGKFLLNNKIDIIAFKCDNDDWFQSVTIEHLEAINRIISLKGYRSVVAYGSSMGGYAAIQFSKHIGCNAVLALSPQYSIADKFDCRWEKISNKILWNHKISPDSISKECKYVIAYDPHDLDHAHAQLFKKLIPEKNYIYLELPFAGHPVSTFLLESNQLKELALTVFLGSELINTDFLIHRKTSKSYLRNLSIHLYKSKKFKRALFVINKAIEMDRCTPSLFIHKGTILEAMDKLPESVESLIESIHLDANPLIILRASKLLTKQGKYQKALQLIDKGLSLYSDMAVLHRQKSEILLGLSKLELALYSAKLACFLDNKNPFYRVHISHLYIKLERYDEALIEINEGITVSPNIGALYKKKIEILRKLGDCAGAEILVKTPECLAALEIQQS